MLTAVIPAHNEAAGLARTIASLRAQTAPVDTIMVVSDNSVDGTVDIARRAGVDVVETVGNTARKAGALNQGLARRDWHDDDLVLVMDADTELDPRFVERALTELDDAEVGAVGAVFRGEDPHGYLETMQHMEWARYAEQIDRTGKTFVLSGTAAVIRARALRDVDARFGRCYDPDSITEDMRMTLDLKTVGWRLRSPLECRAATEMMPSVRLLYLQRRRWYLGAMQTVSRYGLTRVSLPYWGQQAMLTLSVMLMALYLVLTATSLALGWFVLNPFWIGVGVAFAIERVVTVWHDGWRSRLIAALVLPELAYALILQVAFAGAALQHITGQAGTWHHVDAPKEDDRVYP